MTEAELREFLHWFKTATEKVWATWEPSLQVGIYEAEPRGAERDWQRGTCWRPLSEQEITAVERRWGIEFPWDYRIFLRLLGIPDRPALVEGWIDGGRLQCKEAHEFMNWKADELEIARSLNWPTIGLIDNAQKPWWWDDAWGSWPQNERGLAPWEIASKVMMVTRAAPQLIPLYAHRFILPRPGFPSLGLSVMGTDVIVWGADLRAALLHDFRALLPEPPPMHFPEYEDLNVQDIPFWGRIIG